MDSEKDGREEGERGRFGGASPAPGGGGSRTVAGAMFLALFLVVGGLVSWFSMKKAAHNLSGADKYAQFSSAGAGSAAGAAASAARERGFFASEEELAHADPSFRKELQDSAAEAAVAVVKDGEDGSNASAGAAYPGRVAAEGGYSRSASDGAPARTGVSGMGSLPKMLARGIGASRPDEAQSPNSAGPSSDERETGAAAAVLRSDSGRPAGGPGKAAKTSVMDALKSAFKVNVYGARLASNDTARGWIARSFDASPESPYSLEYDEKMKAKLDRMNPSSIPKYLREQNLDASDAKTLGVSEVGKPDFDREGTREALAGDKDYQEKKNGQELAKALFNPLGPFGGDASRSGGASAGGPGGGSSPPSTDGEDTTKGFSDPESSQILREIALGDFVATEGYGAECGCTPQGPCCCLPQSAFSGGCPEMGPFLPNDPCAFENRAGGGEADFSIPADAWGLADL